MSRLLQYLPEVEGEEFLHLERLTEQMSTEQLQTFATVYRSRRRDPQNVLILTLLGFLILAGLQRFYVGQIGMGLLYLFTGGLCLIGTIVDLINHKDLAKEYNLKVANDVVRMV